MRFFISGYPAWCDLLRIKTNAMKTQIRCNQGSPGRVGKVKFGAVDVPLTTRVTFKVVGIEFGAKERVASIAHFSPRLQKALHSEKRPIEFGSCCKRGCANVAHDGLGSSSLCMRGPGSDPCTTLSGPPLWCVCCIGPPIGSGDSAYALASHSFQPCGCCRHCPSSSGHSARTDLAGTLGGIVVHVAGVTMDGGGE